MEVGMRLVTSESMRCFEARRPKTAAPLPVNLDLPVNLVREMGLIIAHWSYLERQINRVISYLLRLGPDPADIAVFQLPIEARLTVALELLARADTGLNAKFGALKTDILNVKPERDQIVDAAWSWDANMRAHAPTVVPVRRHGSPGLSPSLPKAEKLTVGTATGIRKRVTFLNEHARGLFHELVKALPSHIHLSRDQTASGGIRKHDGSMSEYRRVASL